MNQLLVSAQDGVKQREDQKRLGTEVERSHGCAVPGSRSHVLLTWNRREGHWTSWGPASAGRCVEDSGGTSVVD